MRAGLALAVTWSVVAGAPLPSESPAPTGTTICQLGAALSLGSPNRDLGPAREGRTPPWQRASIAGGAGVRSSRGGAASGSSVARGDDLTQARSWRDAADWQRSVTRTLLGVGCRRVVRRLQTAYLIRRSLDRLAQERGSGSGMAPWA